MSDECEGKGTGMVNCEIDALLLNDVWGSRGKKRRRLKSNLMRYRRSARDVFERRPDLNSNGSCKRGNSSKGLLAATQLHADVPRRFTPLSREHMTHKKISVGGGGARPGGTKVLHRISGVRLR